MSRRGAILDQWGRSVQPRGSRPPQPGLLRSVVRAIFLTSLVLLAAAPLLHAASRSPATPFIIADLAAAAEHWLASDTIARRFHQ